MISYLKLAKEVSKTKQPAITRTEAANEVFTDNSIFVNADMHS